MVVRGVYSAAEQKMLDESNKKADMMVGWIKSPARRAVTEDSLVRWARGADYWNPLWRDDSYAMNTRWGGIIAAPFYQDLVWAPSLVESHLEASPELGLWVMLDYGHAGSFSYEFLQPIRPNDIIRVWRRRPQVEDTTGPDGDGPRKLTVSSRVDFINQRDEIVGATGWNTTVNVVSEKPPGLKDMPPLDEKIPAYTKQDLDFIRQTEDGEEIRGDRIRYWEDVNINDELRPVITGPTTIIDMIQFMGYSVMDMPPMRDLRRSELELLQTDPATGVVHAMVEAHFTDRVVSLFGPGKYAHQFIVYGRSLLARLVTNWTGDDGFLKRIDLERPGSKIVSEIVGINITPETGHVIIGDTILSKGKVIDKRVENGEHLVDIAAWVETFRGKLLWAGIATASLRSKEIVGR